MPVFISKKLLTIVEASAMLESRLHPTNASNWLTDTRRTRPCYQDRGVLFPKAVKHRLVWHYPIEEIERVIEELDAVKARALASSTI
jgi:hypothetical protein